MKYYYNNKLISYDNLLINWISIIFPISILLSRIQPEFTSNINLDGLFIDTWSNDNGTVSSIYPITLYFSSKNKFLKLYSALLIIFSLSVFSRLKDHGLEISPQLILLIISYYIIQIYLERDLDQKLIIKKILILSMTAMILRVSSIIILPILILICFKFFRVFLLIKKDVKFILYCLSTIF